MKDNRHAFRTIRKNSARPDSGYSRTVCTPDGSVLGEVGEGNRKDIRNAVEAARTAAKWADQTAHNRAQILYYVAENLEARRSEFADRIASYGATTVVFVLNQNHDLATIDRLAKAVLG